MSSPRLSELKIAERIASTNVNFLFGSGASRPLLATLGMIEGYLTESEESDTEDDLKTRRFLQWEFFRGSIQPSLGMSDLALFVADPTGREYLRFYRALQALLFRRDSATEGRRAKIFTTNYDPFSELALEAIGMDYEDGFAGRLHPTFSTGNYGSLRFMRSTHFDTTHESPMVDVHKLHGSLTWGLSPTNIDEIVFDGELSRVKSAAHALDGKPRPALRNLANRTYQSIRLGCVRSGARFDMEPFGEAYDQLAIVNPSSAKYSSTVLTRAYYDQLRTLSNELERTNSTLMSIGFSFEDSHLRDIVLRAADSNPTLTLIAFAYDDIAKRRISQLLNVKERRNRNVLVQGPIDIKTATSTSRVHWSLAEITSRVLEPAVPRGLRSPETAR
ncbi:MAG: hypothetical protein JWP19_1938 [Rhodoglobus sp.]|nr:hypothetical protein [Rhodoglobus sp.]